MQDSPTPLRTRDDELYEEAGTSVKEYVGNVAPVQKAKKKRHLKTVIIVVVLLLVAGGAGAYYLLSKPEAVEQAQSDSQTEATQQEVAVAGVGETEEHVSQALSLSFDYPSNWAIDETTTGQISVTSPTTKISNQNGEAVAGRVVVTIRDKTQPVSEFSGDAATAALASEKFAYIQPTANQRQETFLTYANFTDPSAAQSFEAVYITGDNGYDAGGVIPEFDFEVVDPVVSAAFYACGGDVCSSRLATVPQEWASNPTLVAAYDLLRSLSIQ